MRRILLAVVGLSISVTFCMVATSSDGKQLGTELSGNYITGVVMDKKKKPISDANISISYSGKELLTVYTSQDGTYKTDNLKLGKYTLEAKKDGYETKKAKVKVKKKKPAKIDFRLKKEVVKEKKKQKGSITGVVSDENKSKVDLPLKKEITKVEEKKYNYITGIVTDEEKNPIFDAGVKISQADKELLRVYTYKNGTYKSGFLKPGKYNLKAWQVGYIPGGMDVEVTEAKSLEIGFQLKKEKYNYASGVVTDTEKNPIFDAGIMISRDGKELLRAYTYKNGTYKSDFLKPGKYNLKAWQVGYMPEEVDIEVTEKEPVNVNFQLMKEMK